MIIGKPITNIRGQSTISEESILSEYENIAPRKIIDPPNPVRYTDLCTVEKFSKDSPKNCGDNMATKPKINNISNPIAL